MLGKGQVLHIRHESEAMVRMPAVFSAPLPGVLALPRSPSVLPDPALPTPPSPLDRGGHLPKMGQSGCLRILTLRLREAVWICFLFELMVNKVQVHGTLRKVDNESAMGQRQQGPEIWLAPPSRVRSSPVPPKFRLLSLTLACK